MYSSEVAQLAPYGRGSLEGFRDVGTFVLLSIRQPILRVKNDMAATRAMGVKSPHLWGWKSEGYRYFHSANGAALYEDIIGCAWTEDAIECLTRVPGLGIVKAAFVAQILGFERAACLDTRNLSDLGLPIETFKAPKKVKPATMRRKIEEYTAFCAENVPHVDGAQSVSEAYWDAWCIGVADDNPAYSPDFISKIHLCAINGRRK